MTEKRFHIINDAGNLQKYGIFCKPVVVDNETDKKYILALDLLDLLNNQHEEIQRFEIDLEDMVDIKNKYKKEGEDYYEMFLDVKKENDELKNKIDVLEDDNETYHKSLEKLNLYTKRFIPTKCTNEFKDCKTNRYYWVDHEGNFEGCLELLNLLDCENELLKSENRQLKVRLMEYEEQIKGDCE